MSEQSKATWLGVARQRSCEHAVTLRTVSYCEACFWSMLDGFHRAMAGRMFPLQDGPAIPWAVIAPFEKQARKQHGGQSLDRLAERCGLSVAETLSVLEGDGDYVRYWQQPDRDVRDRTANVLRLQQLVTERQAQSGTHAAEVERRVTVAVDALVASGVCAINRRAVAYAVVADAMLGLPVYVAPGQPHQPVDHAARRALLHLVLAARATDDDVLNDATDKAEAVLGLDQVQAAERTACWRCKMPGRLVADSAHAEAPHDVWECPSCMHHYTPGVRP